MLQYLFEITVTSGLCYGYYLVFLRNRPFHQFNRFYLLLAAMLCCVFPLLHIPVLAIEGDSSSGGGRIISGFIHAADSSVQPSAGKTDPLPGGHSGSLFSLVLLLVYAGGVIYFLARILVAFRRFNRLSLKNPSVIMGRVRLVFTHEQDAPFSFFNRVFWNNAIPVDSRAGQQVLAHEKVHVVQMHSFDNLLLALLHAFCWVNPFFYFIKREIRMIHEFLADGSSVTQQDKISLAELLLAQAMGTNTVLAPAFSGTAVNRRIAMIALEPVKKRHYVHRVCGLTLAAFLPLLSCFEYDATVLPRQNGFPGNSSLVRKATEGKEGRVVKKPSVIAAPPGTVSQQAGQEAILSPVEPQVVPVSLHLLNYRDDAVAYNISLEGNDEVPDLVARRSPRTQVLIQQDASANELAVPLFYPASEYNEMLLVIPGVPQYRQDDWKMKVSFYHATGELLKTEAMGLEQISDHEVVRIRFNDLPRGTYFLKFESPGATHFTSCKVIKDYG